MTTCDSSTYSFDFMGLTVSAAVLQVILDARSVSLQL